MEAASPVDLLPGLREFHDDVVAIDRVDGAATLGVTRADARRVTRHVKFPAAHSSFQGRQETISVPCMPASSWPGTEQ